jgi:hypothetical protein
MNYVPMWVDWQLYMIDVYMGIDLKEIADWYLYTKMWV